MVLSLRVMKAADSMPQASRDYVSVNSEGMWDETLSLSKSMSECSRTAKDQDFT